MVFVPSHGGRGNWLEQLQATNRATLPFCIRPSPPCFKKSFLDDEMYTCTLLSKNIIYVFLNVTKMNILNDVI